jgi:hypothetical protein
MRFRLRTLLIVVTAAAIIAAIGGALVKARRPVPIIASTSGKQAIERLSNAKSARIDVHWPPSRYDASLSPDGKRLLVAWLSEGVRDDHPKTYVMSGTIKLEPPTDPTWAIMELNSIELGLRVDGKNYWRGLSRRKFEELVIREAASADNRDGQKE